MRAPLTRDGAREAAAHELSKGIYRERRPSLLRQLIDKALQLLSEAFARTSDAVPGGVWGLLALLVLLIAAIVAIRLRTGPLARRGRLAGDLADFDPTVSPEEHRQRADRHAAAGRYAEAIRERLRAVVADLERRAVLEPRPARTADEMAGEAGAVLPDMAADLHRAARIFDDVWYGDRPATAAMAADLRSVDRRVQGARPLASRAPAPAAPPVIAVPR